MRAQPSLSLLLRERRAKATAVDTRLDLIIWAGWWLGIAAMLAVGLR